MRDQSAAGIHHEGPPGPADFDVPHYVPDELEVDLGEDNAVFANNAGHCQCHVWFGRANEFDGSVICFVGDGADKSRVRRVILMAAERIRGKPRHVSLRLALRIKLRNLRDGRHLAQQTDHVEAPFLKVFRTPWQLCRPRQLTMNFLDELTYSQCRGFRLLALDTNEQSFLLINIEPDFKDSVCDQRRTYHRNEQRNIFPKQPSANLAWRVSSDRRIDVA